MAKAPQNAPAQTTATATASTGADTPAKKQSKAFVVYFKADGSTVNFPAADATGMKVVFTNKVERTLMLDEINDSMKICATLQGLATRVQRSYQAEKEIDKCIENFDETVADIRNGVWIESKAGEPKVTLLSQAIVLSLEANGQTVDEERRKGIIEKLKATEYREKAMANEHVKAHLANLKLEAAKQRAKEARDAVKGEKGQEAAAALADF